MPGRILRVLVSEGERVARGATLLILEAMKMEHEIKASRDGVVVRLPFRPGEQVEAGAVLVDFTG
jgi:biotin carboxyl carrier protein